MNLVFNIFPDDVSNYAIPYTPDEIAIIPQFVRPELLPKLGKSFEYLPGRDTFHDLYQLGWRISRWSPHEDMHMVFFNPYRIYFKLIFLGYLFKNFFEIFRNFSIQYLFPIFRYPYLMIFQIINGRFCLFYSHAVFISVTTVFGKLFFALRRTAFIPPASWGVFSGL